MKQKLKKLIRHPLVLLATAWYAVMWSWVLFTDSVDLAGSRPQAVITAVIVLIINSAVSVTVLVSCFRYLRRRFVSYQSWQVIMLGLPLFALMDFVITWLGAALWIGPEGSIDNLAPTTSPALLLVNTPLRYAARIVGFFGIAGFVWLIVFLAIQRQRRLYAGIVLGILCALSLIGWQLYKTPNGSEFKATVISEALGESSQQVGVMKDRGVDLVVFPEYGLDEVTNQNLHQRLEKNQDGSTTYFVGSKQENDPSQAGHLNVLLFGNSEQGITNAQQKYRLIPGGEDLAYTGRTVLRATNQKSTLDYFSYAKMVNKGNQPLRPLQLSQSTVLGAAVCSSIIAPQDYRDFASQGATVLTNSASLSIFKGSKIFGWQQKSLARFMAVANSRYFLQSANAASAYVLDNNGRQVAEITGIKAQDVTIQNNSQKTVYTHIGELLVVAGLAIILVWLILPLKSRHKKGHTKRKRRKS